MCKALNTFITSHTKQCVASFMTVWKSSFDNKRIKLLLLYRKHALSLSNLCDWLQSRFFSRYYFRGFLFNGFNEIIQLSHVLSRYDQLVNTSIHISGSCLY